MVERYGQLALDLEHMAPGAVLTFTKHFSRSGTRYRYAAIKIEGDLWSTTGPKSPKNYTSAEFAGWLRGAKVGSGSAVTDLQRMHSSRPVSSGYSTVHDAEEGPTGLYDSGEPIGGWGDGWPTGRGSIRQVAPDPRGEQADFETRHNDAASFIRRNTQTGNTNRPEWQYDETGSPWEEATWK